MKYKDKYYKMRYIKAIYIGLIGMLLASCSDETFNQEYGKGMGRLILSNMKLESVVGEVTTKAALEEDILPKITDFTIEIVDSEGSPIDTLQAGTLQTVLSAGTYTLKAIYGDADTISSTPAFYGEKEVTIIANQDIEAEIEASLAQAVIRPSIDADLEAQFKEYKLELSNNENQTVQLENNKDFFIPCNGTYTLTLSGTNQLGESFTHTWSYEQEFAVRTRYIAICNPDLPSFTLPEQNITDAWATFIYITPMTDKNMTSHKEDMTDKVLANIVYEASSDGTTWIPSETTEDGKIIIKGLTPATPYTIRSRFGAVYSENTSQLTTENATEVPNGDFEELTETINMTINQGGRWRATLIGSYYQNTCSFIIKEPTYWSSVNAKTCNTNVSNHNSWFIIPSTYNTSLSWNSTVPDYSIFGGGGTETPEIYQNLIAQSYSNAMIVRNVAWDANGNSPEDDSKTTTSSGYYNTNSPTIAQRSAGKLFLGSYSYVDGVENYDEGIIFNSRPLRLEGFYKYFQDENDKEETGMVTVTVLSNSEVIGTGSSYLTTNSDYVKFNVPINYTDSTLKASELKIMITSSNHASYNQNDETNSIKTSIYNGRYESASRGAMLTIDNLAFSYEYNTDNE